MQSSHPRTGRDVTSLSAMKELLLMVVMLNIHALRAESLDKTKVAASLYDTVIFQCSFPFIRGLEGLSVVWEKKDQDGKSVIIYRIRDGQDDLTDRDIDYAKRTELSKDFSQGSVDLTLRGVTFSDEGTYYCRAANRRGHGDKEVQLTIDKLDADEAIVTVIHIDGKKRLKCIDIGVFRSPWVRWYDINGKDLSEYGTRNIIDLSHGRKMVESVLDLHVEANNHHFCVVKEGRLKRTARAVISDGQPVAFSEIKLPA